MKTRSWEACLWLLGLGTLLACRSPLKPATPPPCPPPLVSCSEGSTCVDLRSDPSNCGSCQQSCGLDATCIQGSCQPLCPPGFATCRFDGAAATCADLERDSKNCGGCGLECASWEICREGSCTLTCPAGQTSCAAAAGRLCSDLQSDNLNCGACGRACAAGKACRQGTCDDCRVTLAFSQRDWVFPPISPRPTSLTSSLMAAGDFNGDGKLDVAVDRWGGQIAMLLGNGAGQLAVAESLFLEGVTSLRALTAFDTNRDGRLDLVALVKGPPSALIVLLGKGDGHFDQQPAFPLPVTMSGLTAGDVDGDDHPDLVAFSDATNDNLAGVVVVLVAADGSLHVATQLPVGPVLADVAIADLTGDGILDLALAQRDRLQILHGRGKGDFQLGDALLTGWVNLSCAAGDINGDGRADLMAVGWQRMDARPDTATLVIMDGATGQVRELATEASISRGELHARDVDTDGKLDLILVAPGTYGNYLWILAGQGNGNFVWGQQHELQTGAQILGDWNADGILDVLVGGKAMTIRLGRKGGVLDPAANQLPGAPDAFVAADVDGDGHLDLVANDRSSVSVLRGRGNGSFTEAVVGGEDTSFPYPLVVADFDADGRADACCAGNSILLKGQPDGTLKPFGSLGADPCTLRGMLARDLDRDGLVDLFTANATYLSSGGSTAVCMMPGRAEMTFAKPQAHPTGTALGVATAADLDGDRYDDIVATVPNSHSVAILYGRADGSFAGAIQYQVGPNPNALVLADWNGDGHLDIVVGDDTGVSTFRNLEQRRLAPRLGLGGSERPGQLLRTDFNGDGFDDVLSVSTKEPGLVALVSRGDGRFDRGSLDFSDGVRDAEIADFNEDGRPDLALADDGRSNLRVLLQQGSSCVP